MSTPMEPLFMGTTGKSTTLTRARNFEPLKYYWGYHGIILLLGRVDARAALGTELIATAFQVRLQISDRLSCSGGHHRCSRCFSNCCTSCSKGLLQ